MKAEIVERYGCWEWEIYYNNGVRAACCPGNYTRRDNARRGLEKFLRKIEACPVYLNGEVA